MKENKKGCDLKSCFLCRQCLPEWLPAIIANKKTFHFNKGEIIFKEGDEVKGMYFIFQGSVKVHKQWGKEKELIIRFAKNGEIIGHRGLGEEAIYPVTGTALQSTTVCFIDLKFFNSTLKVNNEFTISLLLFYAGELQRSERKMNNLAHMQVKGRIATSLLSLKNKFGVTVTGEINIILSRQDLASYSGTTYETVFRILNEFTKEDIISVNSKNITIINELQLINFTNQFDN
ncbi:MAG: Crp/Fnr family transcriptional regulator [Bacteroidota bacterium]|nr:Crp/Fnr family transcriptional regulator [Bacteroidota bacterium]